MEKEDIIKIKRLLDTCLSGKNVQDNVNKIKAIIKNNSKGNKEFIKFVDALDSKNKQMDAILLIEAWQLKYARLLYDEVDIGKLLMRPGKTTIGLMGPMLGDMLYRKTYDTFKKTVIELMSKFKA